MRPFIRYFLLFAASMLVFVFLKVDLALMRDTHVPTGLVVVFNVFTLTLFGAFFKLYGDCMKTEKPRILDRQVTRHITEPDQ